MNSVIKISCFALILVYLAYSAYLGAAQQPSLPVSSEGEAPPEQNKKATDAEKIKDRREAAAKAKREAKAKTKRDAAERAKAKLEKEIDKLALSEDNTQRFIVNEVRISGNSLISTEQLLVDMPLVYNASDKPLHRAESKYLYDLRVLHEVFREPNQPHEVSARTIQGFTQYIVSVYQDHDYGGIYVYIPSEAIDAGMQLKDGILTVKIIEAQVADITVTYYDVDRNKVEKGYLRSSAIRKWSPVKTGQIANQKKLNDFVNLLNLNSDRYVSAAVTRGKEPNSLAVGYDIYEANPWHFFVQLDNSNTKDRRWIPRVGLVNTNLLGIDDAFTAIYQAPWEKGMEDVYSIYGSYDFPFLTPRARLNVYAGYSQFDIAKDASGIGFIGNGSFVGGVLRYNVFQTHSWFFDVTGSLSHEISKITPTLFPTMASDVGVELWGVGVNIHRSDDMSNTSFSFNRLENFGGSSQSDFWDPATATGARMNAERDFAIYTTTAAHSQFLDPNKIGRISGTLRWIAPEERLIPAKMTTFGGMYTVRGYEEYEIVADGGVLASVQYEFDLVKYGQSKEAGSKQEQAEKKPCLRKVAPLTFFDYGRAINVEHVPGEKSEQTICSVGIGLLVDLGDNFSGALYYGWPLIGTDDTSKGEGRLNLGFLVRW